MADDRGCSLGMVGLAVMTEAVEARRIAMRRERERSGEKKV